MKKSVDSINIEDMKKSQYRLIIYLSILVFCVLLSYTIIWEVDYYKKYGFFRRADATIVEHKYEDNLVYDIIEYTDQNGVLCRKTSDYQSKNKIGDKITIYYDTNNSSMGIIYSIDPKLYMLPIITLCFGLASGGLVVMYFISFKKKDKRNKKIKD